MFIFQEFFIKASNSFLDCERLSSELVPGAEKNISYENKITVHSDNSCEESPSLLESPNPAVLDKKSSNIQTNSSNISKAFPTTPVSTEQCKSAPTVNKHSFTPDNPSYINSRFTPGFTPKAKKRKFAGPAGLLEYVSWISL